MRATGLRLRRASTPTVLCVATATIAALAATSHGFPVRHVNLNDGGIWVTDNTDGLFGRFNKPIAQLDARLGVSSVGPYRLDVEQNGDLVVALDANAGRLYGVNVAKPGLVGDGVALSISRMALGDSTLAVIGGDNTLRTATITAAGTGVDQLASPRAKGLPPNSDVAVSSDDDVFVVGGGQLRTFAPASRTPQVATLQAKPNDRLEVTAVGLTPVVADVTTKTLFLPRSGRSVSLPHSDTSSDLQLQQSSPQSDDVIAATNDALYSVNLAKGTLVTLASGLSGSVTAPVQVAGCVHAAWATTATGSYVRTCNQQAVAAGGIQSFPLSSQDPSLVFRVNHGLVVLNDTANGDVFVLDSKPIRANTQWHSKDSATSHTNDQTTVADREHTPLKALPVTQGVRPGRTTVVHVLDDDTGPPGHVLTIADVTRPDQAPVSLTISADGQTVLATVSSFLRADAHFQYTITDGTGRTARNIVTLVPRSFSDEAAPKLRDNYRQPRLSVASGASLTVPVINDWRDFDGDPVYLESATSGAAGTAGITSDGALLYTAPRVNAATTATIHYAVSDGIAKTPSEGTLTVHVLALHDLNPVPPQAMPDVAQGIVGAPITVRPLANDVPGADPTDPQARLTLAAPVAPVPGATVTSDLRAGSVTFTAQRAGTFLLTYTAAYGAARTSQSTIRIDAKAPTRPLPPVAAPDIAVMHGQQPAIVDVLANDYDPQGWVLGVQSATADDTSVQVGIIDQRWLRISSDGQSASTSTVHYVVSDGHASATGSVSVTMVPTVGDHDQITARDDSIIIRSGDSAAVPVLANDSSSAGLPLELQGSPDAGRSMPGLYASAQGHDVRITAPGRVTSEQQSTVSYVATDSSGAASVGLIHVTVEPLPGAGHPNQPPAPQNIDTREASGDVVVIHVPVYGIDPDGDSTAVTAVTEPPKLGRIVSVSPTSISYQSYPTETGTDTFTYQVTDPYGATGLAQIRVGVLAAGPPQPPVAVDDAANVPPGSTVHVDVLANDIIAPGDHATVLPLAQTNHPVPAGVTLSGSYVYVRAPQHPTDPAVRVAYAVTDGSGSPSFGHLIVHAVEGAQVAPIARDDVAAPPAHGASTVTVNVLRNDDYPLGGPADLSITAVPSGVRIAGASLTIPVSAQPRSIPYQVTAPDKLTASAVVYVPGTATSQIRLKPGARITLAPGTTRVIPLTSVLTDSAGKALKITTTDRMSTSPTSGLAVSATRANAFVLHALGHYAGPGAVTVEVYDGSNLQDPHGQRATFTIPVQVGADVPILRCPSTTIPVVEGGVSQSYDIGQLCHVWVDTTVNTRPPHYTTEWVRHVNGVTAEPLSGTKLRLTASNSAHPGASGTIRVVPVGSSAGSAFTVTVVKAPPPTARPVTIPGINAGQTVRVDITQYVTSPLLHAELQVMRTTQPANASVSAHGTSITITPRAGVTHGEIVVDATVTDVPGRTDRQVNLGITLSVAGEPSPPGQPVAVAGSHSVMLSWPAASDNGAPIDHYVVFVNGSPYNACSAQPTCTIAGLKNNVDYTFYVVAHNSVGPSKPSPTTHAKPDQLPGAVVGLSTKPSDQAIQLNWSPLTIDGSPVQYYVAKISPAPADGTALRRVGPAQTSVDFTGLTNGATYAFSVMAANAKGPGPWGASVSDIPFGKPKDMPAPAATGAAVPDPASTRAVTVTWSAADGNGRPITGYTVREYSSKSSGGPWTLASTVGPQDPSSYGGGSGSYQQSFTVNNDGTWYVYSVTPTNLAGDGSESPKSTPPVQGVAPPDAPGGLSAKDHDAGATAGYDGAIHVDFTVPQPNAGALSRVEYGLNGSSVSGSWSGLAAPGSQVEEAVTGLSNGTAYVVYVRGCNDAGLCGPWAGPSNQVIPYGPPAAPTVTAKAVGRTITYDWSGGGGNGRDVAHYHVCIDQSCTDPTAPGSTPKTYTNYSEQHTITATVIDTAGQTSPTATASATTVAQPSPPSVSATKSGTDIVFNWSGGGGNGYPLDHYHVCFTNYGCIDTAASNQPTTKSYGPGQTGTITAYFVDSLGDQSNTSQASATTDAETVTVSWGGQAAAWICGGDYTTHTGGDPSCTYMVVSWSGFGSGGHNVHPIWDGGSWGWPDHAGSGSSGTLSYYAAGFCRQSHSASASVDGVVSISSINTNQHSCWGS